MRAHEDSDLDEWWTWCWRDSVFDHGVRWIVNLGPFSTRDAGQIIDAIACSTEIVIGAHGAVEKWQGQRVCATSIAK